jgi:hypothetical protein
MGEILDLCNIPRADADPEYHGGGGGGVTDMSPSVDRSDAVTLGGVCGNDVLGSSFLAITFDCKTSPSPLHLSGTECERVIGERDGEDCLSKSLLHVSEDITM